MQFFFLCGLGHHSFYLGELSNRAGSYLRLFTATRIKNAPSFKTEEGLTADIYNKPDHTKVGFAYSYAAPTDINPLLGADLIKALIIFQSQQQLDPRLTNFSTRYASAQIDARRAYNVEAVPMTISGQTVSAVRFETTEEWNHMLGVLNLPHGQMVFQSVRKNAQVDANTVKTLIEHEVGVSVNWIQRPAKFRQRNPVPILLLVQSFGGQGGEKALFSAFRGQRTV